MKVGIISDIHDNIWALEKVLDIFKKEGITESIFCGDFCAPFVPKQLNDSNILFHCVFGNTDDRYATSKNCAGLKHVQLHGDVAEIEIDGKKIAVNHFPLIAEGLAHIGRYDAVFYGHTHVKDKKVIGNTLLVNPGEIMGRLGKRTYAIYNTQTNDAEFFVLE